METRKSNPKIDLTNKLFTYLTPKYYIKGGKWHCECKCGNEVDVDTRNLNSGHTKSCGCFQKEMASQNTYDMSLYNDDNIQVLERAGSDKQQIAMWKCLCKHCNNIFITRGSSIRAGYTQSCGCIHSCNERYISQMLSAANMEFATQYTFTDLVGINGGKLRFDFAIFNNHILSHLIEYNGLQHYSQTSGNWGDKYETLQAHDILKQQYCNAHHIRLITIKHDQSYSLSDLL